MRSNLLKCILTASLLGFAAPAMAQTVAPPPAPLVTKSAPLSFAYPAVDGFYALVGTEGGGGSANVSAPGVNPSSLVTNQIGAYGGIGYAWNVPRTSMFVALEEMAGVTNFNGSTAGISFSGPIDVETRLLIGAPINQIAAAIPSLGITMPTFNLPAGFTAASTKYYLGATMHVTDESLNFGATSGKYWGVAPGIIPAGVLVLLTNGSALDFWTEIKLNEKGFCFGGGAVAQSACGAVNVTYLAGVAYKFGI